MARVFGLPVPDFEIVDVPEGLIRWSGRDDAGELGIGLAFGSKALPHVQEFTCSHIDRVDEQIRKDVALFDWWLHNADRTLTEKGGNPNLLWDQEHSRLAVIDHNQAFDARFDPQLFAETHVFREQLLIVRDDWVERDVYFNRLAAAFAEFDLACNNAPPEWWWEDDGIPASFNRDTARAVLNRFKNDNFWRIAP